MPSTSPPPPSGVPFSRSSSFRSSSSRSSSSRSAPSSQAPPRPSPQALTSSTGTLPPGPPPAVLRPVVELTRLLLPVACPCGRPDVRWCARCGGRLDGPPVRVEHGAGRLDRLDGVPPLPVWALTPYEGPVRDLVVHWKDRGRADLDPLLCGALVRAARQLAPLPLPADVSTTGRPELAAPASPRPRGRPARGVPRRRAGHLPRPSAAAAVVPVPTAGPARRRRGRDPVRSLAEGVARGLRDGGTPARPAPVLRRHTTRDQVGLGARARGRNLASAVFPTGRMDGRVCILVDDVLTSGATLAASEHALERAGADVLGAIVLAATPPPREEDPLTATY